MDINVLLEYLPLYGEAFLLTLRIGWLGILLSFVIGVACAFVLYFRIPILRTIVKAYIELFRNTPLLVQLFFLYFGLPKLGFHISALSCGVLGLGLLGGSYMTEALRSGLEAVEPMQIQSALALSMNKRQIFAHIILPQAIASSMPPILANVIFLLKETSVFSAISLMDLMFTAKDLIGLYYKTTECLFLLVVFYILMLLPVSVLGSVLEKKVRYAGFGE